MLRSFAGRIKVIAVQMVAALTATAQSAAVSTLDAMKLTLLVHVGAFAFTGSNKLGLSLEHKDENADAWVAVPADDVRMEVGDTDLVVNVNGAYEIIAATTGQGSVYALHYLGYKKQVRVVETVGGTVSVPVSVKALYGDANYSTTQVAT